MYVYANSDCVVRYGGGRVRLRKGEAWHASDPFVKAHSKFFDKAPTVVKGSKQPVEREAVAPRDRQARSKNDR